MESTSIELLHSVQLDMLVKFDKFCAENNLTYFLDSGTALGAVRHGGFIPWDDDVDVGMPREDYNKLLKLGESGLPDNLLVQTYKNDQGYWMPFAKIRLKDTFFPEVKIDVTKMKYQGIYIDVFPFDKVPDNESLAVKAIKKSRFFYFLSVFSRRDYLGVKWHVLAFSRLLHCLPDWVVLLFHRRYLNYCTSYNSTDSHTWTCFCWRMSQGDTYLFSESELFPTCRLSFEGKFLCVVGNINAYLTKMFGNYNELPSPEERKCHIAGPFRL